MMSLDFILPSHPIPTPPFSPCFTPPTTTLPPLLPALYSLSLTTWEQVWVFNFARFLGYCPHGKQKHFGRRRGRPPPTPNLSKVHETKIKVVATFWATLRRNGLCWTKYATIARLFPSGTVAHTHALSRAASRIPCLLPARIFPAARTHCCCHLCAVP